MHFILLLLTLLYHATSALIYNETCTEKCDFPGLICVNNRCVCDSNARLFWTTSRCAPCPNDWNITETACVAYYETLMTWETAKSTCQNMQAELISFRNRDLISLIYNTTNKNSTSAWTSAHATDLSGLGMYQWLDAKVPSFNNESDWWCKKNTTDLGYAYQYDEPTRHANLQNKTEECVVYWRGTTSTEMICLDDQLCDGKFAFVCERSESTANKHLGSPPILTDLVNTTTDVRSSVIQAIPDNVETVIINTNFRRPAPDTQTSNIIMIILLVVGGLFFLTLLGGLLYFFKYRKTSQSEIDRPASKHAKEESAYSDVSTSEIDLKSIAPVNTTVEINTEKPSTNKRSGYSKQQFDELE